MDLCRDGNQSVLNLGDAEHGHNSFAINSPFKLNYSK